jgi:transcriptional antiterminator NusG
MNWYALYVVTGKEEYTARWLKMFLPDLEVTTLIPMRKLMERSQGSVRQVMRKMFPGYLLVNMEMTSETYSSIKRIPNVIRVLNSGERYYTVIPREEINCICQLLSDDGVLDYSKVYFVNSRVIVKSGPLKGMEGLIKAVDRRKLRAKIAVRFMGEIKKIEVGIEVLENQI